MSHFAFKFIHPVSIEDTCRSNENIFFGCNESIFCVIDIRVPLMWNEEEHFRAKESISGELTTI